MAKIERVKILIADDDNQQSRNLASYITDHGFECRLVQSGAEAKALMKQWKPRIILADLMLPNGNAYSLLDHMKEDDSLRHQLMHLIVMSGHNSQFNVKQAFEKGAKDYIVKPFKKENILNRLIFHCRSSRSLSDLKVKEYSKTDEASLMLHLTDLVLRQAISVESVQEKLFKLTRMVSMKVDGVRCSVINVLNQDAGIVVTSNDDRKATGIRLDLNKYPEVLDVVNRGQLVAIENIENSRELKLIRKLMKDVVFNSMIVCPVRHKGRMFGVLSLRMPKEKERISDNEIRFVEIVAHIASLVLDQSPERTGHEFWKIAAESRPIPIRSGLKVKPKPS
jgi:DNA-binding response OmpR family regulator